MSTYEVSVGTELQGYKLHNKALVLSEFTIVNIWDYKVFRATGLLGGCGGTTPAMHNFTKGMNMRYLVNNMIYLFICSFKQRTRSKVKSLMPVVGDSPLLVGTTVDGPGDELST
jgi:hypothetical protein